MEFFKLNPHGGSSSHGRRKELKEQDLIKSLEENTFTDDGSLDCSLSLGRPQTQMNRANNYNLWSSINVSNAHKSNNYETSQYHSNHGCVGGDARSADRLGGHYNWLLGSQTRMFPEFGKDYGAAYDHNSRFYSGTVMKGNRFTVGSTPSQKGAGESSISARKCSSCQTTSTPLWRNGPKGSKSLCNACGIRFKKEERRALNLNASKTKHDIFNIGGLQRNNKYNGSDAEFKENNFV